MDKRTNEQSLVVVESHSDGVCDGDGVLLCMMVKIVNDCVCDGVGDDAHNGVCVIVYV